jgi:PAS domain S-box-containing protein
VLASLITSIWTSETFEEIAESAADAIVAAAPVSAARVRLWHTETHEQAVAAVGVWADPANAGARRLARMFARKSEPTERPLRDKSGHQLGLLATRDAIDANNSHLDDDVTEILATQAGLAAGYIRLMQRYQRLERWHAAQRAELHTLRRTWNIALNEAPVGMCTIDLQPHDRGNFLQVNDALCGIVGSDPAQLVGTPFEQFLHTSDRQLVMGAVRRAADGRRTPATRRARLLPFGDQPCWAQITITPVFDADRSPLFAVCHVERLDGDSEATAQANRAADWSDADLLDEKIRVAAKRAARYDAVAALLLCDLSGLTQVEGLDRDQREQWLTTIERHVRGAIRADDTVSHIDDHTMGVLLDDLDPAHAHTVAERVRKQLAELVIEHGRGADASIGVTLIDSASDSRRVLSDAAAAMRQATESPSRVVLYQRSAAPAVSQPKPLGTTAGIIRNRARRRRHRPSS